MLIIGFIFSIKKNLKLKLSIKLQFANNLHLRIVLSHLEFFSYNILFSFRKSQKKKT